MGDGRVGAIVFCLACFAYGGGQLWATWFRPCLQRYWIFMPRWARGYRASRLGVTMQACVVISLALVITSGLVGIDHRFALWALLLSGAGSFLMWGIDVSSDFNADR